MASETYLLTSMAVLSLAGWSAPAPAEMVLYGFLGGRDGTSSFGMIAGRVGALYGTTPDGGSGSCVTYNVGVTVWIESVLDTFTGQLTADGAGPHGLVAASKGAL